ncbi:MAG: hypothetical protein ACRD98_00925 [Nitrososphaera sp.]
MSNPQDVFKETRDALAWLCSNAPLYHTIKLPLIKTDKLAQLLPTAILIECEVCEGKETNWEFASGGYYGTGHIQEVKYKCRNCGRHEIVSYILWETEGTQSHYQKVGRWPRFQISPSRELRGVLGKNKDFYMKGLTLAHHGFALGAFVYLRRVVEDATDELLDLLEAANIELVDREVALKIIVEARQARKFEDKVKVAAAALPPHLLINGTNPLGLLYKLLSYDIHHGTDESATEVVEGLCSILDYLFVELKSHAKKRAAYAEGLKRLLERKPPEAP